VTHHGSSTSSTPIFLNRFPPKVAVILVGADNPYGHPTPETLDRLRRVGARVFRNDEHGDVIVTIKDEQLDVAVTKKFQARTGNPPILANLSGFHQQFITGRYPLAPRRLPEGSGT
jgi:hypothetical protein